MAQNPHNAVQLNMTQQYLHEYIQIFPLIINADISWRECFSESGRKEKNNRSDIFLKVYNNINSRKKYYFNNF